jgi:hypothetical protein
MSVYVGIECPMCEKDLPLKVLQSGAGFYIGTYCCGPVSRDSGYFASWEEAEAALNSGL